VQAKVHHSFLKWFFFGSWVNVLLVFVPPQYHCTPYALGCCSPLWLRFHGHYVSHKGHSLCVIVFHSLIYAFQLLAEQMCGRTSYSLLFAWLNEHINQCLCKDDFSTFIGFFDLHGPQNMSSRPNSLDQFCNFK
jgi:hypothetical protein